MFNYTFSIFGIFENSFDDRLATLNRKLESNGLPIVTVQKAYSRDKKDRLIVDITLQSIIPHYEGWRFVSKVEYIGNESLLSTLPGLEVPEKYKKADPTLCEHCHVKHVRVKSYIIQHTDGRFMQIGSACLEKYLPHSASMLIKASWLIDFVSGEYSEGIDDDMYYSGGSSYLDLSTILGLSLDSIANRGWVSSAKAESEGIMSTANHVRMLLDKDERQKFYSRYDFKKSRYSWLQIRDYVLTELKNTNDYTHNLIALAKLDIVPFDKIGFVASMPSTYIRHLEQSAKVASDKVSAPVGKVDVTGKIISFKSQYSQYGETTKVLLQCEGWRLYVTLPASCSKAKVGDSINMLVTVTPSDNDSAFAFGNRPSKAKIVTY